MYNDSSLCRFGTPLPPLEEDAVPPKKPVAIEDQIVTDENGRRRFHGAFTGGFSAGYWNTVGSQGGWTPQSFKSSRSEKATQRQQMRPEDFMDDEDKGQFGIAPQGVLAREEYAKDEASSSGAARKRKFAQPSLVSDGAIPGVPVLQQLMTKPHKDKVSVRILKSMGWRPGQGVGPRQTRREKKKTNARNKRELYLLQHYGCSAEDGLKANNILKDSEDNDSESDNDDESDDEITFAPDDYEPMFATVKDNRFGLGYTGLSREPVLSKGNSSLASTSQHINLFGPLEVLGKDPSKKLSITGQAFGVGALEEEDDDIYERDDMTKYDFSLDDRKAPRKKVQPHVQDRNVLDGFVAVTEEEFAKHKPQVFRVELPPGYKPRNWAERKTRFEPLSAEKEHELNLSEDFRRCGLGRHDLNPQQRGHIFGEQFQFASAADEDENMSSTSKQAAARTAASATKQFESEKSRRREADKISSQERTKALLELISARSDNFTRGGIITKEGEEKVAVATESEESAETMAAAVLQENQELLAKAGNKTKSLASNASSNSGGFKPFLNNDAKQQRYEQFLNANLQDEQEITDFLATLQPVHLSEWDREMEKKEFIQARKIYKPLGGIMLDRFVSETAVEGKVETKPEIAKDAEEKKIIMERTKTMWKPASLLCKRYNIADPHGGAMLEDKKPSRKAKLSVFDYLETSVNTKANFQTPVIIPKHIEKPKAIIKDTERAEKLEFLETKATADTEEVIDKSIADSLPSPAASSKIPKTIEKSLGYVPKTELEKLNEASLNKPPVDKLELFKAIFADSDDDKETNNTDKQQTTSEQATNVDLMPPPTLAMPASAAAANLLRNTSPPRGIFAALFTAGVDKSVPQNEPTTKLENQKTNSAKIPTKIAFTPRGARLNEQREEVEKVEPVADAYGPKIPAQIKKSTEVPASVVDDVDSKLVRLLEAQKSSTKYNIAEEWVEKSSTVDVGSSTDTSSDSSSSSDDVSSSKLKKKSKKSKKRKHKEQRVRKHKKKDKKKSKKREKSSHKSKKSKKSS